MSPTEIVSPCNVNTASDLQPYYQEINMLMQAKDFGRINDILVGIKVADYSTILLAGILRLLHPVKNSLLAYNTLLNDVFAEFDDRGLDTDQLLQGL